jgi:hypothetical protein
LHHADGLLVEMGKDGVARNRGTYLLLLDAYTKAGRLEDCGGSWERGRKVELSWNRWMILHIIE